MAGLLLVTLTTGCGSSGKKSSGTTSPSSKLTASAPGITPTTIRLGLLTSFTGPVAAVFVNGPKGFNARIALQNAQGGVDGRKIVVVNGDDQGSASQALAAAQTLVLQDSVFAIGAQSAYQSAAAQFLQSNDVPLVGDPVDAGPEWSAPFTNTVAVLGSVGPHYPAPAAWGLFLKSQGVTKVASVGVSVATGPAIANNIVASAERAGIAKAYLNTTIPPTQTAGFDSIVQAIKSSGADGVTLAMGTATDLGFMAAVQQAGLKLKVALVLPPVPAVEISSTQVSSELQNTWTAWPMTPTLANTAKTQVITGALAKYENQTSGTDENELYGWATADALIQGLKLAGPNPTRASFLSALKGLTAYDGGGVAIQPVNIQAAIGTAAADTGPGPGNCIYVSQFKGNDYVLTPQPVCGGLVPNSNAR